MLLQEGEVGSDAVEGGARGRQSREDVTVSVQFAQSVGDLIVKLF